MQLNSVALTATIVFALSACAANPRPTAPAPKAAATAPAPPPVTSLSSRAVVIPNIEMADVELRRVASQWAITWWTEPAGTPLEIRLRDIRTLTAPALLAQLATVREVTPGDCSRIDNVATFWNSAVPAEVTVVALCGAGRTGIARVLRVRIEISDHAILVASVE